MHFHSVRILDCGAIFILIGMYLLLAFQVERFVIEVAICGLQFGYVGSSSIFVYVQCKKGYFLLTCWFPHNFRTFEFRRQVLLCWIYVISHILVYD